MTITVLPEATYKRKSQSCHRLIQIMQMMFSFIKLQIDTGSSP